MDPPWDDASGPDDQTYHMTQLVISSSAQRRHAAQELTHFGCGYVVIDGRTGPIRRVLRLLVQALLDAYYGSSWTELLMSCIRDVITAHPHLTDGPAQFSGILAVLALVQDKLTSNKILSADTIDAAFLLVSDLLRRVLLLRIETEGSETVLVSIAQVHLSIVDSLLAPGVTVRRRATAMAHLQRFLLEAVPADVLRDIYMPVWMSIEKDASFLGVGLFVVAARRRAGEVFYRDTVRAVAMNIYLTRVLGSKTQVSDSVLELFYPLYADMSAEEWGEGTGLLPSAVCRFVKKTPETVSAVLARVTRQIVASGLDTAGLLTTGGANLGAICFRLLKSGDEAVRRNGVTISVGLWKSCGDTSVRQQLLAQLADALVAKGGQALTQTGPRYAIFEVLWECHPIAGSGPPVTTIAIIEKLLAAVEKEATLASASAGLEGSYGGIGNLALLAAVVAGLWIRAQVAAEPNTSATTEVIRKVKTMLRVKPAAANAAAVIHTNRAFVVTLSVAIQSVSQAGCLVPIADELIQILVEANKKAALLHIDAALAFYLLVQIGKHQTEHSDGSSSVFETMSSAKIWSTTLRGNSVVLCPLMCQFLRAPTANVFYQKLLHKLVADSILSATFDCIGGKRVYSVAVAEARSNPLRLVVDSQHILSTLISCVVLSDRAAIEDILKQNGDKELSVNLFNLIDLLVAALAKWIKSAAEEVEERRLCTALQFKGVVADVCGADAEFADMALPCGLPSRVVTVRSLKLAPPPSSLSRALGRLTAWVCIGRCQVCSRKAFMEDQRLQYCLVRLFVIACHPFVSGRNPWGSPCEVAVRGAKNLVSLIAEIIYKHIGDRTEQAVHPKFDHTVIKDVFLELIVNPSQGSRRAGQLAMLLMLEFASVNPSPAQVIWGDGASAVEQDILPAVVSLIDIQGMLHLSDRDVDMFLNPMKYLNDVTMSVEDVVGEIKITNADRKAAGGKRKGTAFGGAMDDDMLLEKIKQDKANKAMASKGLGTDGKAVDAAQTQRQVEVDSAASKVKAAVSPTLHALECLRSVCDYLSRLLPSETRTYLAKSLGCCIAARLTMRVHTIVPSVDGSFADQSYDHFMLPFLLSHPLTERAGRETLEALTKLVTSGTCLDGKHADISAAYALSCLPRDDVISTAVLARVINFLENRVVSGAISAGIKHCKYKFDLISSSRNVGEINAAVLSLLIPVLLHPFMFSTDLSTHSFNEMTHFVMMPGGDAALRCLDWLWPDVEARVVATRTVTLFQSVIDPLLTHVIDACLVAQRFCRGTQTDPTPERVLLRVTAQRVLTMDEWAPLLGNRGILSNDSRVRLACLHSVQKMIQHGFLFDSLPPLLASRLWLLLHDGDKDVAAAALHVLQEEAMLTVDKAVLAELYVLMAHSEESVRKAAAKAIAEGSLFASDTSALEAISTLVDIYTANIPVMRTVDENLLKGKIGKMLIKEGKDLPVVSSGNKSFPKAGSIGSQSSGKTVQGTSTPSMLFSRRAVAWALESLGTVVACKAEADTTECLSHRRTGCVATVAVDQALFAAVFDFILSKGVVDKDDAVRDSMLTAGRAIIDGYGEVFGEDIQSRLQAILSPAATSDPTEDIVVSDSRRGAAVVLLGAAGKHISLASNGDNLDVLMRIIDALISALDTPAASIQKAVADCLVPLVQNVKARAADAVTLQLSNLLTRCLEGQSYGIRRGAAYGLSALTKGLGVQSLKQYDIINKLKDACSAGSVEAREGSLFAFELLSDRLGLLFEPYVISVIPILLKSFSHASNHVRAAAQGTAGAIMGRLSAHGVKQVLMPILMSLPEESAWKSRQEALRLLGSMAHCAPKQLAACLPQIIPRLVEAGSDPHPKVKESAREAMADISSVIRNPEVAQLSPILLAALGDPAKKTKDALEALMVCEFMHSIDAPSLGLLVPILARALRDRATDLKRKSAMITGNMCAMIADQSVLVPYLSQVVPDLKEVLLDPIPDVRTVAAKALASLVGGVGEAHLPDLVTWLLSTMRAETSSVERSGAAQGLAEVCHTLGNQKLLSVLDTVLVWGEKKASAPREGAMWFFSFLPAVFNQGDEFVAHISTILPVILSGMSDTQECVREVAMRAAQVLVATQGKRHSGLILPSLQKGMSDDDWRVRQNAVSLFGELMYLLADSKAVGLSDAAVDENDDTGVATNSKVLASIRAILGDESVDEVLAELYLARSDVGSTVRQNALQVWKSIVSQTPKTLVQIMPYLVDSIIHKLSDESDDRRTVAAKCLSDLVRKLGDRVLPVIVPHLRNGLDSSDHAVRRGVCMGLSEILAAAGKVQVDTYIDSLVPALEVALCDESSADIRAQGAIAFQTLVKVYGVEAIDQVLPSLLYRLEIYANNAEASGELSAADEGALLGICELVSAKPRDVLESLLPTLLTLPMTASHALILKAICPATRGHLNYHFSSMVPQLIKELHSSAERQDNATSDGRKLATHDNVRTCAAIVMGATTTSGVNFLVIELGKQIDKSVPNNISLEVRNRKWAMWLLSQFLSETKADYSEFLTIILRQILCRSADSERQVLESILLALRALSTTMSPDDLMSSIDFIHSCISTAYSDAKHRAQAAGTATCQLVPASDGSGELWLPLFTVPKALDHIIPLFIHALMNGNTTQREAAANAIGEFAGYSEPTTVLKPHLIKTTGPLIRVAGDRFPSVVKYAILNALCTLLRKGGVMLKAFVPQLQTTFIKAFSDPSRQVRSRGAHALGLLMAINSKPDVVLTELSSLCANAEAASLRASALDGIAVVLERAGNKAASRALGEVAFVVVVGATDPDETVRNAAMQVCTEFGRVAPAELINDLGADILQKAALEPLSATYSTTNSSAYVGSCCAAARLIGSGGNGYRLVYYLYLSYLL